MNSTLSYLLGTQNKSYTIEVEKANPTRLQRVYFEQNVEKQNPAYQNLQVLLSPNTTAVRVSTDLSRTELAEYTQIPRAYIVESTSRDAKFPIITIQKSLVQKPKPESPRVKALKTQKPATPKQQTPKQTTPKQQTPKQTTPKQPTPKQPTPKQEAQTTSKSPIKQFQQKMENLSDNLNQALFIEKSEDEYIDDEPSPSPKIVPIQVAEEVTFKFDGKATVPTWHITGNAETDSFTLEQFFVDLKRCKALNLYGGDAKMIFMALNQSKLSHVLDEIPKGAATDLDTFISSMRDAYGATPMMLREVVRNLKQKPNESFHSFFYRIINAYYRSRSTEPKAVEDIVKVPSEKQDVQFIFLNGLLDQSIAYEIRANATELDFHKLPVKARSVQMAKLANKQQPVQAVHTNCPVNEDLRLIVQALQLKDKQDRRQGSNNYHNRNKRNFHQGGNRRHYTNNRGQFNQRNNGYRNSPQPRWNRDNQPGQQSYQRGNEFQQRFDKQGMKCYNCDRYGHYARDCNRPRKR